MTTSLWVVLGLIVWIFVGGGTRLDLEKFLFLGFLHVMEFFFPRELRQPDLEYPTTAYVKKVPTKLKAGEVFSPGDVAYHDQIIEKMLGVPTIEAKLQILSNASELFNLDTMQSTSDCFAQIDALKARIHQERVMYRYVPRPAPPKGKWTEMADECWKKYHTIITYAAVSLIFYWLLL